MKIDDRKEKSIIRMTKIKELLQDEIKELNDFILDVYVMQNEVTKKMNDTPYKEWVDYIDGNCSMGSIRENNHDKFLSEIDDYYTAISHIKDIIEGLQVTIDEYIYTDGDPYDV